MYKKLCSTKNMVKAPLRTISRIVNISCEKLSNDFDKNKKFTVFITKSDEDGNIPPDSPKADIRSIISVVCIFAECKNTKFLICTQDTRFEPFVDELAEFIKNTTVEF